MFFVNDTLVRQFTRLVHYVWFIAKQVTSLVLRFSKYKQRKEKSVFCVY